MCGGGGETRRAEYVKRHLSPIVASAISKKRLHNSSGSFNRHQHFSIFFTKIESDDAMNRTKATTSVVIATVFGVANGNSL